MPRKEKSIHYLYKTTCKVTGKYYIGMHSTSNLKDGYLGSGKRLRYSIRKHGKDNHEKEILEFFDSRELLVEAEKLAITPDMIVDNNCMNLKCGGTGGFVSLSACTKGGLIAGNINKERVKNDPIFKENLSNKFKLILKAINSSSKVRPNGMLGKHMSANAKKIMGEKNSIKQRGNLNSQYGSCWITKDGVNKKIKREEFSNWNTKGWVNGRNKIKQN